MLSVPFRSFNNHLEMNESGDTQTSNLFVISLLVPLLSAPFRSFYIHNLTSLDEPVCTESVFVLSSHVAGPLRYSSGKLE